MKRWEGVLISKRMLILISSDFLASKVGIDEEGCKH
jgi:hypothetical protein